MTTNRHTSAEAGLTVVAQVNLGGGLPDLVTRLVFAFFGNGLPREPVANPFIGSAPRKQAGLTSAMNSTTTGLGIAMGVATLRSVGTAYEGIGGAATETAGAFRSVSAPSCSTMPATPSPCGTVFPYEPAQPNSPPDRL